MRSSPNLPSPESCRAAGATPNGPSGPELPASEFAKTRLDFIPDLIQAAVLDSAAKRGILNCSRQWGKSTVLAAKAVHRAWTRAGALVLVTGPVNRQSRIFLAKSAAFLAKLGVRRRGDGDNEASLLLPNSSRIVALPGTEATVRGFSAASMILIDEASRVDDAMYLALQPMLAVGNGDLWLLSTPAGKRGFFYEAWTHGEGWDRHTAAAPECPRIPADWLEERRSEMPGPWFRQEFLCEFVEGKDSWFNRDIIEAALSDTEEIL